MSKQYIGFYNQEYKQQKADSTVEVAYDWKAAESFQLALKELDNKLQNLSKQFTIGKLSRLFPKYTHILLDLLESLRDNKKVDYVEYKPFPTLVDRI